MLNIHRIGDSRIFIDVLRRHQWECMTTCLRGEADELGLPLQDQLELTVEVKKVITFKERMWLSFPADHEVWDKRKRVQAQIEEKVGLIQISKDDLEALSEERDLWFEQDKILSDDHNAIILSYNEDHFERLKDWIRGGNRLETCTDSYRLAELRRGMIYVRSRANTFTKTIYFIQHTRAESCSLFLTFICPWTFLLLLCERAS